MTQFRFALFDRLRARWSALLCLPLRLCLSLGLCCVAGCNQDADIVPPGENPAERSAVDAADGIATGDTLPSDAELAARVDAVIASVRGRALDPAVNNAWQIVHGLLAFGDGLTLIVDGQPQKGLSWVLDDVQFSGWDFAPGSHGLVAIMDPGSKAGQGHPDQWLGYLSQCGLKLDDKLTFKGRSYPIRDLLTQAQWDVYEGMEATWTLMAFGTYLAPDTTWTASDGKTWSIERLVEHEVNQRFPGGACGGTHRLYAVAEALNRHRERGGELTGAWLAAADRLKEATRRAREFQQADGSFSADYFQAASSTDEIDRRISATGHTLEVLSVVLDDQQLAEPWVTWAVVSLCEDLEAASDIPLECGGLYHAAHGLQLYRDRRFGAAATAGK